MEIIQGIKIKIKLKIKTGIKVVIISLKENIIMIIPFVIIVIMIEQVFLKKILKKFD